MPADQKIPVFFVDPKIEERLKRKREKQRVYDRRRREAAGQTGTAGSGPGTASKTAAQEKIKTETENPLEHLQSASANGIVKGHSAVNLRRGSSSIWNGRPRRSSYEDRNGDWGIGNDEDMIGRGRASRPPSPPLLQTGPGVTRRRWSTSVSPTQQPFSPQLKSHHSRGSVSPTNIPLQFLKAVDLESVAVPLPAGMSPIAGGPYFTPDSRTPERVSPTGDFLSHSDGSTSISPKQPQQHSQMSVVMDPLLESAISIDSALTSDMSIGSIRSTRSRSLPSKAIMSNLPTSSAAVAAAAAMAANPSPVHTQLVNANRVSTSNGSAMSSVSRDSSGTSISNIISNSISNSNHSNILANKKVHLQHQNSHQQQQTPPQQAQQAPPQQQQPPPQQQPQASQNGSARSSHFDMLAADLGIDPVALPNSAPIPAFIEEADLLDRQAHSLAGSYPASLNRGGSAHSSNGGRSTNGASQVAWFSRVNSWEAAPGDSLIDPLSQPIFDPGFPDPVSVENHPNDSAYESVYDSLYESLNESGFEDSPPADPLIDTTTTYSSSMKLTHRGRFSVNGNALQ